MKLTIIVLLCLACSVFAARAQTDTPTPTPTTGPHIFPTVAFSAIRSPTPVPTSTPFALEGSAELPTGAIYNYLATAEGNLAQAPDDLDAGLAILPHLPAGEVFGYAKWVLGTGTTSELFGPLAPVVNHLAIEILIVIVLASIYVIIFIARFVIRFVSWIITNILKLVPFFG